jgi:hypothetical protein
MPLLEPWTDLQKWLMGLAAVALAALAGYVWVRSGEGVVADIASNRDGYGRCVDAEIRLYNGSNADASEVVIAFDVDHYTRSAAVAVEYGDEREQLVAPGRETLLKRGTFVPIEVKLDQTKSTLAIPRLKPGEAVHLFFGGDLVLDRVRADARERQLLDGVAELMNKPRVATITRKDGVVNVRRIDHCSDKR